MRPTTTSSSPIGRNGGWPKSSTQCAAVSTFVGPIRLPPQNWISDPTVGA